MIGIKPLNQIYILIILISITVGEKSQCIQFLDTQSIKDIFAWSKEATLEFIGNVNDYWNGLSYVEREKIFCFLKDTEELEAQKFSGRLKEICRDTVTSYYVPDGKGGKQERFYLKNEDKTNNNNFYMR